MRTIFYKTQSGSLIRLLETKYSTASEVITNHEQICTDALNQLNKGRTPKSKATIPEDLHYSTMDIRDDGEFINSLMFDLDYIDQSKKDLYIQAFSDACNIPPSAIGIIDSGGGIHLVLDLKVEIKQTDTFFHERYHAVCKSLDLMLRAKGLVIQKDNKRTHFDPYMYIPHKTIRLPGTINAKYDPPRMCRILQGNVSQVDFLECIDTIKKNCIDLMGSQGMIFTKEKGDAEAVLQGCSFLQHYSNNQHEQTMPIWLAMGQAYLNFKNENKVEMFHDASKLYPNFDQDQFDQLVDKIESNEYSSYGCKKINELWGKCDSCPNYGKVNSPMMIASEHTIFSESAGFWLFEEIKVEGKKDPVVKAYVDNHGLFRKYTQEHRVAINAKDGIFGYLDEEKGLWVFEYDARKKIEDSLRFFAQKKIKFPKGRGEVNREKKAFTEYVLDEVCNVTKEEIDATRLMENCLSFENGMYNIVTGAYIGQATDKDKTLYITSKLPYAFDPKAAVPALWLKTLSEWFQGDQELIDQLGYTFAHVLSDSRYFFQVFHYWYGDGGNGKSLAKKILMSLAKGSTSCIKPKLILDHRELTSLVNALVNLSEEFNSDELKGEFYDELKNLCAGGEFEYSEKWQKKRRAHNKAKFIFISNNTFKITDANKAMERRIRTLPFTMDMEKVQLDPYLEEKLITKENLSGILNWAISYVSKLEVLKEFPNPEKCRSCVEDFKKDNPVSEFLESEYMLTPKDLNGSVEKIKIKRRTLKLFFDLYCRYVLGHKYKAFNTSSKFYDELSKTYKKRTGVVLFCKLLDGFETYRGIGFDARKFINDGVVNAAMTKDDLRALDLIVKEQEKMNEGIFDFTAQHGKIEKTKVDRLEGSEKNDFN